MLDDWRHWMSDTHPYFRKVMENIAWNAMIEPGNLPPKYILNCMQQSCPGDYDLVINPPLDLADRSINSGSMGFHIVFKDRESKIEWLLRWS